MTPTAFTSPSGEVDSNSPISFMSCRIPPGGGVYESDSRRSQPGQPVKVKNLEALNPWYGMKTTPAKLYSVSLFMNYYYGP